MRQVNCVVVVKPAAEDQQTVNRRVGKGAKNRSAALGGVSAAALIAAMNLFGATVASAECAPDSPGSSDDVVCSGTDTDGIFTTQTVQSLTVQSTAQVDDSSDPDGSGNSGGIIQIGSALTFGQQLPDGQLANGAVTGNVTIDGTITDFGEPSNALRLGSGVGGSVLINGTITAGLQGIWLGNTSDGSQVTVIGDFTNNGTISAGNNGVQISTHTQRFDSDSNPLPFTPVGIGGDFVNTGTIIGDADNDGLGDGVSDTVRVSTGSGSSGSVDNGTVIGDFTNMQDATIQGGLHGVNLRSIGGTLTNSGRIIADPNHLASFDNGVLLELLGGDFVNTGSGLIDAEDNGVRIDAVNGNFNNAGTITGGVSNSSQAGGVLIGDLGGTFLNSGTINGGVELTTFGGFSNSGTITSRGVFLGTLGTVIENDGNIVNSGSITSDRFSSGTGLALNNSILNGSFQNTATGIISGNTGVALSRVQGDITNAGQIVGDLDMDGDGDGLVALIFAGDVINLATGVISGENGLRVSGSGQVRNAGTITGNVDGDATGIGVVLAGETDGGFFNQAGGSVSGVVGIQSNGISSYFSSLVINAGTITGTGGTAIALETDSRAFDILEIHAGSVINGAVTEVERLRFGGSEDFTFDVSQVSSSDDTNFQYRGFDDFEINGSAVYTLTGSPAGAAAMPLLVTSGTGLVNGDMSRSNVTLTGGVLGGTGSVGSVVATGGRLAPGASAGTLTVNGDLTLSAGAVLAFELGAPGIVGGTTNDLIIVTGDLTLDGSLDVTALSGFGNGLYTLVQYGNLAADDGLEVGSVPAGYSYDISAGAVGEAGEVTVLVGTAAGGTNQFWDGANTTPGGIANGRGGSGDWDGSSTNWTDLTGSANAAWGDEFAIFGGTAGTVSVLGSRTFTGMQFLTDGYSIFDGDLGARLNAVSTGATINVASDVTATIGTTFTGGAITKTGTGTLVVGGRIVDDLGAVDTWTVDQGELRIDGSFKAGAWSDDTALILNNGTTLTVTGSGGIDRGSDGGFFQAVEINGQGDVTIDAGGFVGGYISGTADSSTVHVAGTMSTSLSANRMIVLLGSDNLVEVADTGQISTDAIRANAIRVRGDDNRVVMDGTIHTTGAGAAGIQSYDGDGNEITVSGDITTEGSRAGDQFAFGIDVTGDDAVVDVSGTVTTTGGYATGIRTTGDNASVTVSGSISTSADLDTVTPDLPQPTAIRMEGAGNQLDISGIVQSSGSDVAAVALLGGTSTMVLSGTVAAANAGETAIRFDGAGASLPEMTLELQPGYSITGLVIGDTNAFRNNLVFGGDSGSDSFDVSAIDDAGQFRNFGPFDSAFFKTGDSVWTLTGTNDTLFPSIFRLQGGTLLVDGSMAGTGFSNLANTATLGGSGTVGYVEMHDGGTLAPGGIAPGSTIGTFTTGSLSLSAGAVLDYDLGAPNTVGGTANDLIVVTGNLTLDGTLDVTDAGGFGNGEYTLIQYGNLLADNGLDIGTMPDSELTYVVDAGDVGTGSGVVLLTVSGGAAGNVQYWDGPSLNANSVEGGNGAWNAANTNWTNQSGAANDVWGGQFAIFSGVAGTVTVDGAQAFTGMQFLTSGYEIEAGTGGELTASLADTRIRVGSGITATISAPITGSGGIAKQEAGTLVLSGANSHTGTTAVNGGVLRAGANNAFSALSAHVVASGAVLDLDSHDQAIGSLAGDGGVMLGSATLTAGGDDTSTTFGGVIEGDGGLTKTGIGELRLTGENSFTGVTTIAQGSLSLGNGGAGGSVAGDIFNDNAFLVFNRSDDFTYASVLSGSGATSFVGSGMTTLTGASGGLTGPAFVTAGNLRIGATGSFGASLLTVDAGGTLSGLGAIVGDVSLTGGTLAPGAASLGTLTVQGNVSFDTDSSFGVRIAADGGNDALAATTVNLDGGVAVTAIDPHASYVDGQTYTILTTTDANGVSGTFDGATMLTHSAFLTPTLTYGADNVMLTVGVTADFTTVAETYNQTQAASALNGLEQTGDALVVFNELAQLDPDEARAAFALSSGEVHAAGQHVIDQTFALFSHTLRDQAGGGLVGGSPGGQVYTAPLAYGPATGSARNAPGIAVIDDALTGSARADARVAQAWLAPLGGRGTIEADGNAAELDWWTAGLAGGYEGPIDVATGNAWLGFGLGYLKSHGAVDARLSTFDGDNFNIGVYGGWTDGPWSLSGSLAYMASKVSTERSIVFGGINRTAEADYWNHTIGFSGEAAYGFILDNGMTLSPLATLDARWSGHGGFTETGAGSLNLTGAAESWTRFDTGFGFGLAYTMPTETGAITFEGRVLWEHAFADVTPGQTVAFVGSPTAFTVHGPDAGPDRLRLGAGLSWNVSEGMSVNARYDGLFSGNQTNHTASLGLNIGF